LGLTRFKTKDEDLSDKGRMLRNFHESYQKEQALKSQAKWSEMFEPDAFADDVVDEDHQRYYPKATTVHTGWQSYE